MSASEYSLTPEEQNARDAIHNAEEGDEVLWGDRVEPLTVTDVGGTSDDADHYLVVRGPRGGTYTINEFYTPTGAPDFRTDSGEQTNDLRIVNRGGEEGGSGGATPTPQGPETTTQGDDDGDGAVEVNGLGSVGHHWPDPPRDAAEQSADDYITDLVGNPLARYKDLLEGSVEDLAERNPIAEFMSDSDPSWTFVDELLAFGEDVPKTVNNWRLIDYGYITDSTVDDTRKMAWYNFASDELLVLAGVNDGDGPIWLTYHTHSPQDIHESDRQPDLETREFKEALEYVEDHLYGARDSVDISVQETPDGDVSVVDAISNTRLAQKIMSVRGADPFGIRGYVSTTSTAEFIHDLDNALFDTLARARSQADSAIQRIQSWFDQNRDRLMKRLGRLTKVAIVKSVSALSTRFTGIRVKPVIEYRRLGLLVEYKYKGAHADEVTADFDAEFTVDLYEGAGTPGIYGEGRERTAKWYLRFLKAAEIMHVNNWEFNIGGDSNRTTKSGSSSVKVGTAGKDAVAEELKSREGVESMSPEDITAERLSNALAALEDDASKRTATLYLLAASGHAWLDERGDDITDRYESQGAKRDWMKGTIWPDFRDVVDDYGLDPDWFTSNATSGDGGPTPGIDIAITAIENYQTEGAPSIEEALYDAVIESPVGPEELSTPKAVDYDFDNLQPVASSGDSGSSESDDSGDEGGDSDSSGGGSPRNMEVNRLVQKLESGKMAADDLSASERELLRDASVDVEELSYSEEDKEAVESIRDYDEDDDDAPAVGDGGLESVGDPVPESAVDDIKEASPEEKQEMVRQFYQDSPDAISDFESRDDEFDRLP